MAITLYLGGPDLENPPNIETASWKVPFLAFFPPFLPPLFTSLYPSKVRVI